MRARFVFVAAGLLWGCSSERLVVSPCREDADCEGGNLCEDYRCIPAEQKSCENVVDGNPILQPSPHAVSFGSIDTVEATRTIELHNLGTCTLTLFEASLTKKGSPFSCAACEPTNFPLEIFPGRHRQVEIAFKSDRVGSFDDALAILSDDREFPELKVPVHANFLGVPSLKVAPDPVDFGYVAQGRLGKKTVQITNQGTGVAPVVVESVSLEPKGDDFELVNVPSWPVTLVPVSADLRAVAAFEIHYHPRSVGKHQVELLVKTTKGEHRVTVKGDSQTPPKIAVSPQSIDLGKVPLGQTNYKPLTIVNEGGAPLHVSYSWGGPNPSTDLFATPQVVPAIAAGQYLELQVGFTATAIGPLNGLLLLSSDDPSRPSITIPVAAEGVAGPGPEVVKIDMVFDNGSDTAFDKDLRNVDMTLEHPFGYVCNKQNPSPKNWGNYGNPTWIAFGVKEEPERIVLADARQDGTYRVMLQYVEDCASLPTELLAGLLGISVELLIEVLTGGAPSPVPGSDLSKLIEKVCFSKKPSNVTLRTYVNGNLVKEKTVSLSKKGDTTYALDLVRANGTFTAQ